MNFFDRQVEDAKNNYNYFFVKLFFNIFEIIFKLSIVFIISSIINFILIDILVICFTIYSFYEIYRNISYYIDILSEIKSTLGMDWFFEIDLKIINKNFLRDVVKYGK